MANKNNDEDIVKRMVFDVVGTRGSCYSNRSEEVACQLLFIERNNKQREIWLTKGCVTGFENFSPKAEKLADIQDWLACNVTPGEWDSLLIPAKEMRRAFKCFGLVK